jgi:isoleucyl-tRNA synthetase
MSDYKDTLNLPQTAFAMKANLPNREPEILSYWEEIDLYGLLKEEGKTKEKFILHDGPPYANGELHIGHAINKTLKDLIIKTQTLNGKYAPYTPGWDCHGLPIELNVEKKVGKAGHKVSKEDFRDACRKYASSQIDIQRDQFKRLGVIGDWENPYISMDFNYEANIVRSLGKIIDNGYLVRGEKPVHWCVDCGSALAEAEVEYKDKVSLAIDFGFLFDPNDMSKVFGYESDKDTFIMSWTTTPWTLPGNVALTISQDFTYSVIEAELDKRILNLIIAKDLVKSCIERLGITKYSEKASCKGKDLEGFEARHPYLDRSSKIILGDHVTTEAGTGIVHTAPGHGLEDYQVAMKYNLEVINPVKNNGTFKEDIYGLEGMFAMKANEKVLELLDEAGSLFHSEDYAHSYPHCWRHKTPLMFRATPQWFIGMDRNNLLEKAKLTVDEVDWKPDWGQARMKGMLEDRPDWCISRQRTWGVPIPLILNKETSELHPDMQNLIEKIALKIEEQGLNAWYSMELSELIEDHEDYEKIDDCLDVWFDSGVSHSCVLNHFEDLQFPADVYLEGSDQHRGWFQSALLTSVAMYEEAPYREVITHGFVIDSDGQKMSKSIGNTTSPKEIWNSKGADVLRIWIASTDYRKEMVFSQEILKNCSDAYRRIRNTIRFLLGNLNDFNDQEIPKGFELAELDNYMISRTKSLQEEIVEDYNNYQFHRAFQKILNFCTNDLGGFYLDVLKDRLYTCAQDSQARISSQIALNVILESLLRWVSPILCFTAEEAYKQFKPEDKSVHLLNWFKDWPEPQEASISKEDWDLVFEIKSEVNKCIEKARNSNVIGSSLDAEVQIHCTEQIQKVLSKFEDELRFIFITSDINLSKDLSKGESTDIEGLKISVVKSENKKCERCWHRRPEVGTIAKHGTLCSRCVENIEGAGEIRIFA